MPNDDVPVRVAGRSFGYDGETYTNGDELEVDEATLENHPRTLEALQSPSTESVDDTASAGDDEDEGDAEDVESYDREELEDMEYSDLQSLAAESDHPDVDGRSSQEDIVEALSDE